MRVCVRICERACVCVCAPRSCHSINPVNCFMTNRSKVLRFYSLYTCILYTSQGHCHNHTPAKNLQNQHAFGPNNNKLHPMLAVSAQGPTTSTQYIHILQTHKTKRLCFTTHQLRCVHAMENVHLCIYILQHNVN